MSIHYCVTLGPIDVVIAHQPLYQNGDTNCHPSIVPITSGHFTWSFTSLMRAMANVNAELVKSGRGTNLLRGYSLRKDRRYPAKQHWRCTVPGCPGRAHTDFTDPPTVLRSTDHNHIPDEDGISRKRTKHVLCDAAKNRPLVPLSQVSALYTLHLFPLYVRSMIVMRRLHWTRSCASYRNNSLSDKSLLPHPISCIVLSARFFTAHTSNFAGRRTTVL